MSLWVMKLPKSWVCEVCMKYEQKNSMFATLNDIDHFMKTILVGHVTESRLVWGEFYVPFPFSTTIISSLVLFLVFNQRKERKITTSAHFGELVTTDWFKKVLSRNRRNCTEWNLNNLLREIGLWQLWTFQEKHLERRSIFAISPGFDELVKTT